MFRDLMPKGLFGRALILVIAPILIFQAVMIFVFLERHLDWVTRHLAGGMSGDIAFLVAAYDRFPDPYETDALNQLAKYHHGLEVTIEPAQALPPARTPGPFDIDWLQLDIELSKILIDIDPEFRGRMVTLLGSDPRKIEIYIDLGDRMMHVRADRAQLRSATTYLLFYWVIGLTFVLVPTALLFLRNQIKPIQRLTEAAESFGRGVDDPGFKPSGATEVRRAGAAFLDMRRRIRRHIEQRTAMLAAVSHDLRTPLTRLKLELALLPPGPEVDDMNADVAEMERMVSEYLAFAQGQSPEDAVEEDLSKLLTELVDESARHGAQIEYAASNSADGRLIALVRRDALKRLLNNLVDNARRYGDRIIVSAERKPGALHIMVDDNGPGIPAHRREDAFRPFNRLDPARDPNRSGVGLGLAIARDIARGHGGDVTLDQAPIGGLRAIIRLPV